MIEPGKDYQVSVSLDGTTGTTHVAVGIEGVQDDGVVVPNIQNAVLQPDSTTMFTFVVRSDENY